jgi:magnesium transporter
MCYHLVAQLIFVDKGCVKLFVELGKLGGKTVLLHRVSKWKARVEYVTNMLRAYFKRQNRVHKVQAISDLESLENLIWIDLQNPTPAEIKDVEANFEFKFQSRQEQLEIESSSRYFETDDEIIANSNFLKFDSTGESLVSSAVSFILQDDLLFTYRESDLGSFSECVKKIKASGRFFHTGKQILATLLEIDTDNDADLMESVGRQVSTLSREMTFDRDPSEEVILKISSLLELTMTLRQDVIDKQRVLSAMLKSREFEGEEYERLRIVIKDINSLIDHTKFTFERLEYLQTTVMGLINIEQNKIIKIFTVASVIFMPPTLIASIYGMNFNNTAEFEWKYGFWFAVGLMVISSSITLLFFRRKNWL